MRLIKIITNLFKPPINPKNEIHIKVNGEAVCGQRQKKYSLRFGAKGEATCKRCLQAVER